MSSNLKIDFRGFHRNEIWMAALNLQLYFVLQSGITKLIKNFQC